jgi:hypothetical protein
MISHNQDGINSQYAFQAALCLGLRQKEWLFLTSHNHWVVFRLVRGGREPTFLAFSPLITVENSSAPLRTFLGAILSVLKGGVVEASVFDNSQTLDTIGEEEVGSSYIFGADYGSGGYQVRSAQRPVGPGPLTRKRAHDASKEATLMVRPSCAPFYLKVRSEIHLDSFRHLPLCLRNHFKFGSIFTLSQTTSLLFRQLFTMTNNVCG